MKNVSVTSRLVVLLAAAGLFSLGACVQPGAIDDPAVVADADPNQPEADAAPSEQADAEPGAPDAAPSQGGDPTFTADVYPLLQANSLTCGNCHKVGGIAAFLPFDDGAGVVYGRLMSGGQRVNVGSPESSLILQKPLQGSALSHRIKIFQSTSDPRYQLILKWIQTGAPQ
jgi:hypothetical protein